MDTKARTTDIKEVSILYFRVEWRLLPEETDLCYSIRVTNLYLTLSVIRPQNIDEP